MYQHTVEKDSYYKNKKQKSNVVSCTPFDVDNTLLRLCLLQDDDDTSKDMSSNNAAASSIFGVSMDDGASSMSSVSLTTFDKYIREHWRRARKLQKRNNISLFDNMYTDDGIDNKDTDKLETAEVESREVSSVFINNTHDATRFLTRQETKKKKSKLQLAREKIARHRMKSSRSKDI